MWVPVVAMETEALCYDIGAVKACTSGLDYQLCPTLGTSQRYSIVNTEIRKLKPKHE